MKCWFLFLIIWFLSFSPRVAQNIVNYLYTKWQTIMERMGVWESEYLWMSLGYASYMSSIWLTNASGFQFPYLWNKGTRIKKKISNYLYSFICYTFMSKLTDDSLAVGTFYSPLQEHSMMMIIIRFYKWVFIIDWKNQDMF